MRTTIHAAGWDPPAASGVRPFSRGVRAQDEGLMGRTRGRHGARRRRNRSLKRGGGEDAGREALMRVVESGPVIRMQDRKVDGKRVMGLAFGCARSQADVVCQGCE